MKLLPFLLLNSCITIAMDKQTACDKAMAIQKETWPIRRVIEFQRKITTNPHSENEAERVAIALNKIILSHLQTSLNKVLQRCDKIVKTCHSDESTGTSEKLTHLIKKAEDSLVTATKQFVDYDNIVANSTLYSSRANPLQGTHKSKL